MTIHELQKHVGAFPDGLWGVKSASACQEYLRSLMPKDNPWPKSDTESLVSFYGKPGNESNLINLDVKGLGIYYDGARVKTIRCHHKVGESLHRVLTAISKSPDAELLKEYAGCYNYRVMRDGTSMSCHAWGIAVDIDPENNGNRTPWPKIATMPITLISEFSKEGWLPAGPFWGRDSMHFQATQ